jgi:O-antigen ligase
MQTESTAQSSPATGPMIFVAGLIGLWLLLALNSPATAVVSILVLAAALLIWAAWHAQTDGGQLLCAAVLIELLSSATILPLSEEHRFFVRYPLLLMFCGPAAIRTLRQPLLWKGGFRDYLIYLGWAGISVSYSLTPGYSFARFTAAVLLFLVVARIAKDANDLKDIRRLLRWYAIGTGVVCLGLAAALFILPHDMAWQPDELAGLERFSGFFDSPNAVGEVTLAVVGIASILWSSAMGWERTLIALEVGLAIALGVLTDSRSPFVGLGIGIVAFVFWKYCLRALPIFLAFVVLGFALARQLNSEYFIRGDVSTLTGRTDVWRFSIQKIKERPLIGWGYEVEGEIFKSKYFPVWWGPWDNGSRSSLHNGYLARAEGLGLPAFAFWVFIFLRPWVSLFRRKEDPWQLKRAFFLIVLPVLILNMSESTAGDCRYAVGLIMTLCWALAERQRLETPVNSQGKFWLAAAVPAGGPNVTGSE